ncbi:zinc finger, CCHC-type containing protein [Tanacetum coccineum]
MVPLRSDTIRLVQNGCSFYGLRSEDLNQHLKDFLKLVDSLDLDVANRERIWEDLTTHFLAQFFPPGRTAKLRNDILMFQQHQGESLSETWTRFKDLRQKVLHHGIDLWLQIQIFYDHVSFHLKFDIEYADGGKLRDKNVEESWEIIENLALYDHEGWNDPRDFAKPLTTSWTPEKVLVREEASNPITKCVNAISLVKMEKYKNIENNEVVDKSVIEPSELNLVEPTELVDRKKEIEDGTGDKLVRSMKEELTCNNPSFRSTSIPI